MADELTPEHVAYLKSFKIDPRVQAQRDEIARSLIASESSEEQLDVNNITNLGNGVQRPVSKKDMRLRGSSDVNAPTLSANDFNGNLKNVSTHHDKVVEGFRPSAQAVSTDDKIVVGFQSASSENKNAADNYVGRTGSNGDKIVVGFQPRFANTTQENPQETSKEATWGDRVTDHLIAFEQGGLGVAKSVADTFGANNAVSTAIDNSSKAFNAYKSDEQLANEKRAQAIDESSKNSGVVDSVVSMWEQIKANPAQISTVLGGMLPYAIGGAQTAVAKTAMGLLGIAQGLGDTKGQEYEKVYSLAKEAGYDEQARVELATKAQEYGAKNLTQQAMGAVLGFIDAKSGVERTVGRITRGVPSGNTRLGNAAKDGFGEAVISGAQGAQGEYAGNVAAIDANLIAPEQAFDNVASRGYKDATMGAVIGAPFGALQKPETAPKTRKEIIQDEIRAKKARELQQAKDSASILTTNANDLSDEELGAHIESQVDRELASEALPASDLLEDDNVSNTDNTTDLVAGNAIESSDNASASAADSLQGNGSADDGPMVLASNETPIESAGQDSAVRNGSDESNETLTSTVDLDANAATLAQGSEPTDILRTDDIANGALEDILDALEYESIGVQESNPDLFNALKKVAGTSLNPDEIISSINWALKNDRKDIAEAGVKRLRRSAISAQKSFEDKPSLPITSTKYQSALLALETNAKKSKQAADNAERLYKNLSEELQSNSSENTTQNIPETPVPQTNNTVDELPNAKPNTVSDNVDIGLQGSDVNNLPTTALPKVELNRQTGYIMAGNDNVAVLNTDVAGNKNIDVFGLNKLNEADKAQAQAEINGIADSLGYTVINKAEEKTQKTVPLKTANVNPLIEKNRAAIESLIPRMAWGTIGNKRIDDANGNQVGRTKFVPIDDAMEEIRKQGTLSYNGMRDAVDKALTGKPLSKAEKRTVDLIADYAESNPVIASPIDEAQAATMQAEYDAEPAGTFDELVYGLDSTTAKVAATELSDDALLEGNANLMTYEEVEALFNSVGVSNETSEPKNETSVAERVETQAGSDDTRGTSASETENVSPQRQPTAVKTQENSQVRPIVEAITKRRAAATQLGKLKQFDTYLALAKKLMNGEAVKPTNFKLAATTFKADAKLAEAFTQLAEIAKEPAKEARAEVKSAIEQYINAIANAKTADELQTIAGEIQRDTTLTDAQAVALDDAVFEAQDALESTGPDIAQNEGKNTQEPSNDKASSLGQTLSQPETEETPEAVLVKADFKSVETTQEKSTTRAPKPFEPKQIEVDLGKNKYRITVDRYWLVPVAEQYEPDALKYTIEKANVTTSSNATYTEWRVMKEGAPATVIKKAIELLDNAKTIDEGSDLLGDNTAAKQAIADAERAKDAKRNSGEDNASEFNLTGSDSEADKAAAAGVTGTEKLNTIAQVRDGKITAEEVIEAHGTGNVSAELPTQTISDFGEKLEGAKKDLWRNYQKAMSDELPTNVAEITLSKNFPEPDYDNLIASGLDVKAIAAIKAMRDEISTKPKLPSKVRRWASEFTALREFSNSLINGSKSVDDVLSLLKASNVNNKFEERIKLYGELGFPALKSAKGYSITGGWSSFAKDGAREGQKHALELPNGRREYYAGYAEALDALRAKLETAPESTERKTKLDVYRVTKTGEVVIGKKVASNKYIDLKGGFKSSKEAFEYYRENEVQLLELLEQRKNFKPERKSVNNPRIGEDYRLGEDITPEKFAAEFGFRGVQFGNYVEQSRRPRDLNNAYDALLDLAHAIGIPPKAISLNGTLGLAFGARGSGGKNPAAAHYEPSQVVINLTKVNGFGSLGHEWFHAMDNHLSKARGKNNEFVTGNPRVLTVRKEGEFVVDDSVRPELLKAFEGLMKAIKSSPYYTRSVVRDKTRTNDYWGTDHELAARAFEAYLIAKFKTEGKSNDYLANVEDEAVADIMNDAAKEFGGSEELYPYPTRAEQVTINPLFDALFDTLQTKETNDGNVALFSRGQTSGGMSLIEAQSIIDELQDKYPALPKVNLVQNRNEMPVPQEVINEIEAQILNKKDKLNLARKEPSERNYIAALSAQVSDINGMYINGEVWLNLGAINNEAELREYFAHEAIGHLSVEQMLDEIDVTLLPKLLKQIQTLNKFGNKYIQGIWKDVKKLQPRLNDEATAKEVLAFIAQRGDQNKDFGNAVRSIWQKLMDGIKAFAKLVFDVDMSDQDVRDMVAMAERRAKGEDVISVFADNKAYFSLSPSIETGDKEVNVLVAAWQKLASNRRLFQLRKSDSQDMIDVFNDVAAGLVDIEMIDADKGAIEQWKVYPIDSGKRIANKHGIIRLYDDGKVEIDVLNWGKAFGGSAVYGAVANWAYNTGNVFAGDRQGISSDGIMRRLENMISTALKFGTTDHIAPHPDMAYSLGLKWKEGNTEYNLDQMLNASYNAIKNGTFLTENEGTEFEVTYKASNAIGVAKIEDLFYDTDDGTFKNRADGKQFTDADFAKLATTYGARNVDAGSATLKRAIITSTSLRAATQGQRGSFLGGIIRLSNRDNGLNQAEGIAYSRSNPQQSNNNGNFDGNNDDIRFSRQGSLSPQWSDLKDSKLDNVVYILQDKHVDLKRVTQAIKKAGVDISDRWNAYLQEELYHGRTAKRTQDFIKNDLEPLIEAMRMRDLTMADFEEYLWMRHAEERNIQISKVNPDMKDGGSGVKTAESRSYLAGLSTKQKTSYEALAKRIDAINRKSRQVLLDYGLESADTIAAWEGAYKNYVPLMREDMDAGFGSGTGQGFSVKGNASKRATGSNRAVVDIIANIAQQYEKNIIRGEKNRVSTALIGLAKLNPNENFWKVDTPPTITQINKTTGLVETRTDPNYKGRDNVVVARIPDKLGKIQERAVIFNEYDERAMRMAASIKNLDQDQIGELLGAASTITRWFASVNTQYNPIFGVVNIVRDVQGSMLNLSTTPIANKKTEILTNTPAALLGIYKDLRSVRKGKGAVSSPWATLYEEFQDEGGQTGYRDMFRNAKERGDALKNALDPKWWQHSKLGKILSLNGFLATPEQWLLEKSQQYIFEWLSDYNSALENAVRLSVYKVAKDNGQSKQQAASIAKNISVNFNRKGEVGRQVGSLYAFFNASVQGTARISETLFINQDGKVSLSKTGGKIVAGGLLLGAMQALLLAAAGFDDDEPPEFVRDRNIIIPLENGKYITLAMPLGFNAIPAFGRIVTEWAMSGFKDTNEHAVHVLDMLFDVTNPIGNAGLSLQTIAPTVIDPFAALAENKDFAGRPIAQKDFNSLKPTAGHTRAKDTASKIGKALSYGLNSATGGNEYKKGAISPTPDQIDYLIGQVTGGVGREAMKAEQTFTALRTGEDLPTYKIPLIGRFYGDANSKSSEGAAFYKNVTRLNQIETELKGRRENKDNLEAFKADTPEYKLIMAGNTAENAVSKLRKRRRALLEDGASKERIKLIDELITRKMKTLNDRITKAEAE